MDLPPIRKIFSIIDSCDRKIQLEACERLTENYVKLAERKGVINPELIKEILHIKIKEKAQELNMSYKFKGKIRRRKPKLRNEELERALNFYA